MKTKVLITVKAYPAISKKYDEVVCTAGITEDGKWIRLYPIPFRKIDYINRYHKYQWIELDLVRYTKDARLESHRPYNLNDIKIVSEIPADGDTWIRRRDIVLKTKIYNNLTELIQEAKDKSICTSLATFKPTKIKEFYYVETEREWNKEKMDFILSKRKQQTLFGDGLEDGFDFVNKLPYDFRFVFEDNEGKESDLMIEDWETGQLYWNSLKINNGDEKLACEAVKNKYFYDFARTKDYYFFLGTTSEWHFVSPNPFVIIGDFRPKHITQDGLF